MMEQTMQNDVPTKLCTGPCGRELPATKEYFPNSDPKRGYYLRPECLTCYNERRRARRKMRNGHIHIVAQPDVTRAPIGTPDQCGSCATTAGNIIADVEEMGGHKFGYLCMRCHRILQEAKSDTKRLRNVLSYIERAREGRVE